MPNTEKSPNEFIQKLKELLEEYQCSISFECSDGSDTHGISGEKIVISQQQKVDGRSWLKDVDIASSDGWWLDMNRLDIPETE